MNTQKPTSFFPCISLLIVILILLLVAISACRGDNIPLPNDFLVILNKVEASGRHSNVPDGDSGHAKGPFQVHYQYWKDSGVVGSYSQCSDYNYSVRVVTAYLNRYEKQAIQLHDYESLARLHNSGPQWRKNRVLSNGYWQRFQKAIHENNSINKGLSSDGR